MEKHKENLPSRDDEEKRDIQFSDTTGLIWMLCGFAGLVAAIVIAAIARH